MEEPDLRQPGPKTQQFEDQYNKNPEEDPKVS